VLCLQTASGLRDSIGRRASASRMRNRSFNLKLQLSTWFRSMPGAKEPQSSKSRKGHHWLSDAELRERRNKKPRMTGAAIDKKYQEKKSGPKRKPKPSARPPEVGSCCVSLIAFSLSNPEKQLRWLHCGRHGSQRKPKVFQSEGSERRGMGSKPGARDFCVSHGHAPTARGKGKTRLDAIRVGERVGRATM